MSDHDRGAYTPQSESPLAFDARRSRGPGERPRSGALMFSGIILLVLVVALAVFAVTRMDGGEGVGAEGEVYEVIKSDPDAEPVEQAVPEPSGMVVEPVETLAPTAPAVAPDTPVASPTPAPKAEVVAAPAPKPAPKAEPAPTAPAAVSNALVQIGAFSTASMAENDWNDLALSIPADMAGKTRRIEPIQADGETRYRSLVGGFTSRDAASAFCDRLKARGRDCFVR